MSTTLQKRLQLNGFRALFDRNVVPLAFWKADGKIVDANRAYLKLTGRSRKDLTKGAVVFGNFTPAEYKPLDARAMRELRTGKARVKTYEKEYVRKDGQRVPVLISGALLPADPDHGLVCALDLTRHKAIEAQLQESRTLLDTVLKSLNALVVVVNRAGKVVAFREPRSPNFRRKSVLHMKIGIGLNYLALCRKARDRGDR